jgi:hypothetical protein
MTPKLLSGLALIGFCALASAFSPPIARADEASPAALIGEAKRAFTLNGKPIPPEIFRDFGDGDIADSGAIRVTIDAKAAIGSNLYYDAITTAHGWVDQKTTSGERAGEETAYHFVGATQNGLLVFITSWQSGGSGDFIALHIIDIAAARGLDLEGKPYQRINLTTLRSIPLGDRWDGEVTIAKNTVRVVTTRSGPADDSGAKREKVYEAVRP